MWSHILPPSLKGLQALELGAAGGGPSLWLAVQGATVTCSDITSPAERAQPLHQRYRTAINYAAIDARALPFASESLDIICCKSVLGGIRKKSHLDPKPQIISEIHRVLKPGGYLLSADNLSGHSLHQQLRQRFVVWSEGWEYFTVPETLDLLSPFWQVHYTTAGLSALVGRTPTQRSFLGTIDFCVSPYFSGQPPHYMLATVARKEL